MFPTPHRLASSRTLASKSGATLVLALISLVELGCVSRVHLLFDGRSRSPENTLPALDTCVSSTLREGPPGSLELSMKGARTTAITWHRRLGTEPRPAVLVLPIWGASEYPQRKVVSRLLDLRRQADRDLNILAVHGTEHIFEWTAMQSATTELELEQALSQSVAALNERVGSVLALIDWLASQPEIDSNRIGITGFSIGAIASVLIMGRDSRLAAGAFVMGGGHFEDFLVSCRGKAAKVADNAERRFGWNDERFRLETQNLFNLVEPLEYASRIDPQRALVIDAGFDTCIPSRGRNDLWLALGRPERISLRYGHKMAFLSMTPLGFDYTARKIVDFFSDKLFALNDEPWRTVSRFRPWVSTRPLP